MNEPTANHANAADEIASSRTGMKGTLIQLERELDEEIEDETYRERLGCSCFLSA